MPTHCRPWSRPKAELLFAIGLCITSIPAQGAITQALAYPIPGKAPVLTCTDDVSGKPVDCPEAAAKKANGRGPVEVAFNQRDFVELDAIFKRVSSGEPRFADGSSYLESFLDTLDLQISTWKRWDVDLAKIEEWQRRYPESIAAKFAEAQYWRSYAWSARGGTYASQVRKESWDLFHQRLAKAEAVMDQIRPQAKHIPAWYMVKILLAIDAGNQAAARALFDEGIGVHRQFYPLYLTMARGFEPRWGGSLAAFEAFAVESTALARGFEGTGMYARIYWAADFAHGIPFKSEKDAVPRWKALQRGFADLHKLYPNSHSILNQYASVACRANDGALYRSLRTKLGDYLDEDAFSLVAVDVCDRKHQWRGPVRP